MTERSDQRKANRKRTQVTMGAAGGALAATSGNLVRRSHQVDQAVSGFKNRPRNDLAEGMRASHRVNTAVRNLHSAGKKTLVASAALPVVALGNAVQNRRKMNQVSKSAFGIDHEISKATSGARLQSLIRVNRSGVGREKEYAHAKLKLLQAGNRPGRQTRFNVSESKKRIKNSTRTPFATRRENKWGAL